jgi:hypothetical protein
LISISNEYILLNHNLARTIHLGEESLEEFIEKFSKVNHDKFSKDYYCDKNKKAQGEMKATLQSMPETEKFEAEKMIHETRNNIS